VEIIGNTLQPRNARRDKLDLLRLPQRGRRSPLGLNQVMHLSPDLFLAFVDTAAVMSSLDLIVTADTAVAHLAGALGRPTWVALKYVPHWTWMLEREDSPWYPTVRLFRQPEPNNWASVFSTIEQALRSLLRTFS
jgi:Glycosyltransferase family 9 (heptosyltransferase)